MPDPTPVANLRVPRDMWAAYKRVCERLGRDRTDDLLSHIRRQITEHGDDTDRAALEAAEAELAERRARKGGRPRKNSLRGPVLSHRGAERKPPCPVEPQTANSSSASIA